MEKQQVHLKNTNNKEIIPKYVLNSVLHHVGLSKIVSTKKKLEYNIEKHNPDWITNGTLYTWKGV